MVQYDMKDVFEEAFREEGLKTSVEVAEPRMFEASVYKDGNLWLQLANNGGTYSVYIDNPLAELDEKGQEVSHEQWVFGEYKGFKRALNKALAITRAGKYPKPILKW